ncbi:MAG TPA: hypothetical protein VJX67_20640 [Blastocatellia bacterium]|nr:hypothetical protein [Blastocatellia bacterium]
MREGIGKEDLMARYLLGQLSDEENARIEQEFLCDDEYFEQLSAVEAALIDDYIQGRLSKSESTQLEGLLHSSAHEWGEVEFSRSLIDAVRSRSSRPTPKVASAHWWLPAVTRLRQNGRTSLALAALLIIVLLATFSLRNRTLERRIQQLDAERLAIGKTELELRRQLEDQEAHTRDLVKQMEIQRDNLEQVERELDSLRNSKGGLSSDNLATILLVPGIVTKGGEALKTVRIKPGVTSLRIEVSVGGNKRYVSYGVIVKTFDDRQIWARDTVLPAPSGNVIITLPAATLASDDYTLTLRGRLENGGLADLEDYSFRVRR